MPEVTQSKFRKRLETAVNVLLIVVFLGLIGIFANRYFIDSNSPKSVKVGDKLSLPDLNWEKPRKTLLIFLQSDCKFSSDGSAFYVDIAKEITDTREISLVTIFSTEDMRRQEFLNDLGLANIESREVNFQELGILGRPAIALVDNNGIILSLWKGVLSPKQENEVRQQLGLEVVNSFISETELEELLKNGQKIQMVDVRDRETAVKEPVENSINIPLDEIPVRAVNELSSDPILVRAKSNFFGESAQRLLAEQGFRNVRILDRNQNILPGNRNATQYVKRDR